MSDSALSIWTCSFSDSLMPWQTDVSSLTRSVWSVSVINTVSSFQQLLWDSVRLKLLAGAELPGGGQSCSVLLSTFHRPAVH